MYVQVKYEARFSSFFLFIKSVQVPNSRRKDVTKKKQLIDIEWGTCNINSLLHISWRLDHLYVAACI